MRWLLIFLFVSIAAVSPALAATIDLSGGANDTIAITFSNLDLVRNVKYIIYQGNEYLGEVNATDTVILDATKSYLVVMKPDRSVWLSDPLQTVKLFVESIPSAISIIIGFGIGFLLLGLIARGLGFRIRW